MLFRRKTAREVENCPALILDIPRNHLPNLLPQVVASLSLVLEDASPEWTRRQAQRRKEVIEYTLARVLRDRQQDGQPSSAGLAHKPKYLQVVVLRRLIFTQLDTILVAPTGFGKSIIFQTFTLLTGRITLQVVPLVALGQQHLADVASIPGARPCLITEETRGLDRNLFRKISAFEFTHILLGPEQLLTPKFREMLADATFQVRVGILVIDEAHCLSMWSGFRSEYANLHRIRSLLPRTTVLFACTATMDPYTEDRIIKHAGFGHRRGWTPENGIIRMSVDRPEIAIVAIKLPATQQIGSLLFIIPELVNRSADDDGAPDPYLIKKTIIFANTIRDVSAISNFFQEYLHTYHRYPRALSEMTAQAFHGRTPTIDRDSILKEYGQTDSKIRILVATNAFGMGMDIPDIEQMVQFRAIKRAKQRGVKVLPGYDRNSSSIVACDLSQRMGRVARGPGRSGIAYFCIEHQYWPKDSALLQ